MNQQFIDLGLPSGTLWAAENEDGYFTFDEAVEKFGNSMPTKEQFEELIEHTDKYWDLQKKGMWFVGRNGSKMFMPALGHRLGTGIYSFGYGSGYWSATPYSESEAVYFGFFPDDSGMCCDYRHYGRSVRLVNSK